ncbi:MAG: radical SAM protein [Acidobacteriota bacterium]
MGKPFTLRYTHNDKRYIYDVNTNCILEVDDALFTLIDHVEMTPDSPAPVAGEKLRQVARDASLTEETVNKTLETIKDAYLRQGLFSDMHPKIMQFPFTKEDLQVILSSVMCRLILGITENCNLRCAYCKFSGTYQYSRTHSNKQMTEATALKAVRFMMDRCSYVINETNEPVSITFYGGEPFLNFPVIRSCVSFVNEHYPERRSRVLFALTSNLTTRREEILEYLVTNQIDLTVSLDGPQMIHDRYRVSANGAGSFSQVKKNLETLRRLDEKYYNEKVNFSIVVTPPYELEAIVDYLEHDDLIRDHTKFVSYADTSYTTFYDRFDMGAERKALGEQLDCLRDRFNHGIKSGSEMPASVLGSFASGSLRYVVQRTVGRMSSTLYPNGACVPGAHRTFVTPDGKLYLCERVGEELSIGDLDNGFDFEAIDQALQRYIAISKPCLDCWAVRFCGACFLAAVKGPELCKSAKNSYCEPQRRAILLALKQYSEVMESNPETVKRVFSQPDTISTVALARGSLEHHQRLATARNVTTAYGAA